MTPARKARSLPFAFFALLFSLNSGAASLEINHQGGLRFRDSEITRSRFSIAAGESWSFSPREESPTIIEFDASARASTNPGTVEVRHLTAGVSTSNFKTRVGFQEIAWGETFGFFISDVVNPRDLTDPLLNELGWTRIPVFAVNSQLFLDSTTFQLVYTPVPRNVRLPKNGDPFFPTAIAIPVQEAPGFDLAHASGDAEYGGRLNHLFEMGLDASVFYYSHWNRNTVYEITQSQSGLELSPVLLRTETLGFGGSYALGSTVLRGDTVLNFDEPQMREDLSAHAQGLHWQSIVGVDHTTEDQWTLGGQIHTDFRSESIPQTLYWASGRIHKSLFEERLETEFFIFKGMGNSDFWLQPKITWNLSANLTASLSVDWLAATPSLTQSALGPFDQEDRIFTWIRFRQ